MPGMDEGDGKETSAPLLIDYHDTSCIEDGSSTCDEETLIPKDEYTRGQAVAIIGKQGKVREVRTVSLLVFVFAALWLSLVGLVVGFVVWLEDRRSSDGGRPLVPLLPRCSHPASWLFETEDRSPLEHTGFHHVAETSFELPASANALSFVARGDAALAHVKIEIANSETISDMIRVNITSYYNDVDHFLNFAQACELHHGATHGVEISAARHMQARDDHRRIQWDVKVQLPRSLDASPRSSVRTLTTNMPYFSHEVGDIGQSVFFNTVFLWTANMPVDVKSVTAESITVTTSNGHIGGSFNATKQLRLCTSNAPISATVAMLDEEKNSGFTNLYMHNSNGPIVSNISLHSGHESGTGGRFTAFMGTSNSPLDIAVVDAPVDHTLVMTADTRNSPALVVLHKTYEGSFKLSSPPFFQLPTIQITEDVDDPAGWGRSRNVAMSKLTGGVAEGSARWLPADRTTPTGSVRISTSNLGLDLSL